MKNKLIGVFLTIVSALCFTLSGCKKAPEAPDYSGSTLQYDFYGYSALIDSWNIDGISYYPDEDYLTVERIKEYKDAGMTIYFPQISARVDEDVATNFENSNAKKSFGLFVASRN